MAAKSPSLCFFWDIQNCAIPKSVLPYDCASRIRASIKEHKTIEVGFNAYCDVSKLSQEARQQLCRARVNLRDVPSKKPAAADIRLLQDILLHTMTHRSGIIVLISGDIDFAETLHDLVHTGGYTVILIHNGHARLELRNNASELRDFEDVVSDNSLITKKFTTPSKKAATEESLWSCEVCGKTFASQKARDSHVEATGHLNECNECGKTFQSKLSLKQHQDSLMHGSVKCNECGKEFQSSKSLEQHQNATGHISVSCDDCGNIFTSLQRIHQHMARKNHSGSSSWECRQCPDDAPWYSLSDLLDHLRLDH